MGGTTEDDLSLSAAAVGNASSLVRFPLVVMLLFRARLRDRKVGPARRRRCIVS